MKLPVVSAKKLLKALLRAGFYIHHKTGSHLHLRHYQKDYLRVVVPYHLRDLAPKTIKTILIQSELTLEELRDFL